MLKIGMIVNLPKIMDLLDICEECDGKASSGTISKEAIRAKAPLEPIHTDVYEKMETKVLVGSYYFGTLIDDNSMRIWIYFLKTKD